MCLELFMVDSETKHASRPKPVTVFAITAGKGGVGKSNVAANLSIALAQKNKQVMLLDADLGIGNIDILLGLQANYNIAHVLKGECALSDIILKGPCNVSVIPAASGADFMTKLSPAEHAGIINSFSELTDNLDYLIIDTAAGISDTVLSFARSSQELIVLLCDEPTSMADAFALIKLMYKRYKRSHFHILVNMVRRLKDGRALFNKLCKISEQFLDIQLDYLGALPFDEKVHQAVKKQEAVLLAYPDAYVSQAFTSLAKRILDRPYTSSLGGNTSFFLERLVAGEI
ncbi:MAG: MinD/ParA family protein [Legionella sp.]|nr:MinD/ParA family protein [Legionella sp.]